MKKIIRTLFLVLGVSTFLSSCGINGHNHAELKAVNADDTRIYGDKGQPARQTLNKYPDDSGKQAELVDKIRTKLYPR